MADFRRWILAFATLVLVLGFVAPASAQNGINCTASAAVTPTLRHEGFTELTGDILLTCIPQVGASPTPPGTFIPQATVTVSLSAPITSRVLTGSSGLVEALLVVDNPTPTNQDVCLSPINPIIACRVNGDNGETFNQSVGSGGHAKFNVFQGISGGPGTYSVTFLGVPVDPPLTSRTYRITNIRVDATSVPSNPGQGGLSPVFAFVSASPSQSIQINNPQNYVGFVSNGLTVTYPGVPTNLLECLGAAKWTHIGGVDFTENFPTAFKVKGPGTSSVPGSQNTPGVVYYTEAGLEITVTDGVTGWADAGTRLQTVISNIPSGVSVAVDNWALSTASVGVVGTAGYSDATLVTGTGTPVDPGTSTITQVADGTVSTATVVWEVTNTNTSAIDSLTFGIYAAFKAGSAKAGGPPAAGLSGFNPQLAAYSSTGPIPEFSTTVNIPTAPTPLFSVSLCQTILLFPYVTDFYGFDTGLAISNTALDPLSSSFTAAGETGKCSVYFYGGGGLATTLGTGGVYTSAAAIPPGETWAFSMSGIDPGYNSTPTYGTTGYAIATCDFQFAHGYSFVSDTGIRNFAAAYLALIIPDEPREPQPFTCSQNGGTCSSQAGEQLVH